MAATSLPEGRNVIARKPSSVSRILEEENDLLISILERVSFLGGGYKHALVCRLWAELSPPIQKAVHICRPAQVAEAELVRQLRNFPNLRRIRITQCLPRITDFFLGALSSTFRHLRHLELHGRVYLASDDTTGEGWASLFKNVPDLESFAYSGIREAAIIEPLATLTKLKYFKAEDVTSLPDCLGNLTSLEKLCILGNWSSNTTLPSSIGQLKNLKELTFHSGSNDPLPEEIGQLTSLKHLNLELYHATTVPDGLTLLTQLKTLQLRVCLDLVFLPEGFGNLRNLRLLKLECCPRLQVAVSSMWQSSIKEIQIRACPMLAAFH